MPQAPIIIESAGEPRNPQLMVCVKIFGRPEVIRWGVAGHLAWFGLEAFNCIRRNVTKEGVCL